MIDVKQTIEANQLSTARGRRTAAGREIDIEEKKQPLQRRAAIIRAETYLDAAASLKEAIGDDGDGISFEELDAVEFIMEQLEKLSRKAWETAIEKN